MSDVKSSDGSLRAPGEDPKGPSLSTNTQDPAENVRTRRWVIVSFWLVALLLGVPMWWTTTTVYRANLPLEEMHDWADGKICAPNYPIAIVLEAPLLQLAEAQSLLSSTQAAVDHLNPFAPHHLRLSLIPESGSNSTEYYQPDGRIALSIRLVHDAGVANPQAKLRSHTNILDVFYSAAMLSSSISGQSALSDFIANELQQLYAEEKAILATLTTASEPATVIQGFSPKLLASLAKRATRSVKYAPTYHLTFSLFTPTASPSGWNIERALTDTFLPLLKALSPISNFTVDTQVQLYSTFSPSVQPVHDEARNAHVLSETTLPGFINAAEWSLSPSIGAAPTINFLLYAASPPHRPLVIENSISNSWLVPQWGGIAIFNGLPDHDRSRSRILTAEDLEPSMLTFSSQLMSLLGVPSNPPQSLPMRLSTMGRARAAMLFYSASATLGSLARLVSTLPSIAIPDSVAQNVATTMTRLQAQCSDFQRGEFAQALENGKIAEQQAEKAFFEKSMVGQVYFPDEHKIAVYLPLLGPVSVPLIVAALRELKAYLSNRRAGKKP